MKRLVSGIIICAMMALMLSGCGKADGSSAEAEASNSEVDKQQSVAETDEALIVDDGEARLLSELTASDYVTLGEYKGIKADVSFDQPTDEEVQEKIEYALKSLTTNNEVDRAAKEGDVVNIDYEGKKDGVAFQSGTATGYDLELGSGTFIPGFEDGLIGVSKGETVDIDLTFPENYKAPELAGQAVVFTVKVNSVNEKVVPELTDEVAAQINPDCKTADELKDYIKKSIAESNESAAITNAKSQLITDVIDASTFKKIPKWLVEDRVEFLKQSAEAYAQTYGMSFEDFLAQGLNESQEQFDEECHKYGIEEAKQMLVVAAIAQAEGLEIKGDELESKIMDYKDNLTGDKYDDIINSSEGRSFAQYLQMDAVTQFLYDNAEK